LAGFTPRSDDVAGDVEAEVNAGFHLATRRRLFMNENPVLSEGSPQPDTAEWKRIVASYQNPSAPRALWQIVNTLVPYGLLWYLMYRSLAVSWWITVPLAVLAGAFLVRVFIIFHDCGHGSFFKSRGANSVWGFLCGLLTFTPFYH